VLEQARSGAYSQLEIQRGLSAARLVLNFTQENEDRWIASPELLRMVTFDRVNLLNLPASGPSHDIILCRNMLLYQGPENRRTILRGLADRLLPGGYLVLGGTETAGEYLDGILERIQASGWIFYRRHP
jgi:chemotaxis protein methyltransferase CheR